MFSTEVSKQCSVNNGGCSHFCAMRNEQIVCQCSAGYELGADRMTCEPTGDTKEVNLSLETELTVLLQTLHTSHLHKWKLMGTLELHCANIDSELHPHTRPRPERKAGGRKPPLEINDSYKRPLKEEDGRLGSSCYMFHPFVSMMG